MLNVLPVFFTLDMHAREDILTRIAKTLYQVLYFSLICHSQAVIVCGNPLPIFSIFKCTVHFFHYYCLNSLCLLVLIQLYIAEEPLFGQLICYNTVATCSILTSFVQACQGCYFKRRVTTPQSLRFKKGACG